MGEGGAVRVARECGQHVADVASNPVHEGRVSSWESISPCAIIWSIEDGAKRVLRLHKHFGQPFTGGRNALATRGHSAGHSIVQVSLEAGT